MKDRKSWKKALSVLLSTAMVVGLIGVAGPKPVKAADPEANVLTNGDFEDAPNASWEDQDETLVGAQEVVDDVTVHEIVTNGDFEAGNSQSGVNGWQSRSGATLSVIYDSTDQTNQVLQVEATGGGAQANFYFGQEGILEVGKTYTVSFDVKQTAGSGGFTKYSDSVVGGWISHKWEAPSSEWRTIEYDIIPTQSTAWAQIGIQFDAAATFCIDNFSIAWKETKMENVTGDIVENGDFEAGNYQSGVNGWQSRSGASLSVIYDSTDQTNQVLQVEATGGGAQANFYFGQEGILEVGKTYTVSFDVKQTAGSGGFTKYSDSVVGGWISHKWEAPSSEWRTIEYDIIPTQSTAWAQIGIQFDAAATFCIDNFSITYDAGTQVAKTYTEGIGTCKDAEPDNVLAMKDFSKVTHDVEIKAGNRYDYSFKVKKENAEDDLTFGVTAGENATETVTVTDAWTEVGGSFTATADATEFGFTRGGTGTVLVDDVVLNETAVGPSDHTSMAGGGAYVPEGQINILNGAISDFSSDAGYSLNGVGTIADNMLKITANDVGNVQTPGIEVVANETYTFSCYAWVQNTVGDLAFNVYFTGAGTGWKDNACETSLSADTEGWTLLSCEVTPTSTGTLYFGLKNYGTGSGTIYVDDIALTKTKKVVTDHTSMADGGYYIAIEDAVNLNAGGELSAKGDWFTSGAEVKDGMGVVHTSGNYLQTPVFNLTKDHTYTMSAYVWVEKANEGLVFDIFSAGAASPTGTWQDYGMAYWTAKGADCNRSASMSANTYGWELVTVTWTAKNDGPCYFGFKNYDGSGDVYVDDVAIYDHAVPEYVDIELSYAGSEYANNDFTVYVDNDLTEELWNTNYPSSAKTIVQASSVWINDTEYTNINYFFDAPNKKVTIWNVATNAGVAPESIEKVEIKAGTKIAFTGYPIARITKGFVIEKNAYGQWVDPSNTDTGEDCTLTFGWFDYYADKTAALNGMPAASGEYLPLSGAVLVNGDIYTATFTHNDTSATLNFNAGTLQNALSETEMNTVVIPKDLVLYNGKDAVCKIAEELTFYVQKKNGVWLSWTKDGYLTEEEHIQYFDMGTEGTTYTFNNNADATYMGVLTVTGKDTFALAGQENASKEVSALGDYFVSRTIKGEKYDYTVALYKRGDADSTMDGVLNSKDLVAAKKAVSADEATFGYARYKAADSNTDGVVDEEDAAFMRHILAGDHVITTTTSKGYSTLGQGVMPIIGYNGPSDCNTMTNTDATKRSAVGGIDNLLDGEDGERVFGLVKDLGINVFSSMVHEVGNDYDDSSRMLKMADKYGLGVFINNAYINDASSVAEQLSPQTAKYESFGSFHGYYVADEPKYSEINNFATTLDTLKNKVNIASYFNMFSVNASSTSIGTGDYAAYLNRAAATSAETMSYDLYLRGKSYKYIGASAEIKTSDFYKNLDQARTISMNASKPFQAFVQTGANWIDNTTNDKVDSSNKLTIQEMYLEANAALAMGAKGIHYFTLIESADQVKNGDDYSGLITVNGQANNNEDGNYAYYNAAKKINTYIAKVDEVLMNATSKGVITNSTIQGYMSADDTKLTSYGAVTSVTGTNAFVGCFDYYGKNAYMVVNTSTSASETITLNMADTITYTYTGMDCASHPGSGTLTLAGLGAGESVLVVVD